MDNVKISKSVKERVQRMMDYDRFMTDKRLIQNIWYNDLVQLGMSEGMAKQFIQYLSIDSLTNPETIRRTRQKIQQDNPEKYGSGDHEKAEQIKLDLQPSWKQT
jgi:hypothetical protein